MLHSVNDSVPPEFARENCPNNAIRPLELERLILALKRAGYSFAKFLDAVERGGAKTVCLTFDDGLEDNYSALLPILRRHSVPCTCFVTNRGAHSPEFLSPAQIREMDASGLVEIGGHTANHAKLDELPPDAARREIVENKLWLEDVLGRSVASFCYPKGGENDSVVRMVRDAGYACAAAMVKKMRPPSADPYRVHRQIIPRGMETWQAYLLATRGKCRI